MSRYHPILACWLRCWFRRLEEWCLVDCLCWMSRSRPAALQFVVSERLARCRVRNELMCLKRDFENGRHSQVQVWLILFLGPVYQPRWILVSQEPYLLGFSFRVLHFPRSCFHCRTAVYLLLNSLCPHRLVVYGIN